MLLNIFVDTRLFLNVPSSNLNSTFLLIFVILSAYLANGLAIKLWFNLLFIFISYVVFANNPSFRNSISVSGILNGKFLSLLFSKLNNTSLSFFYSLLILSILNIILLFVFNLFSLISVILSFLLS